MMEWIYAGFLLSAGVMIGVAGWKFIVQKVRSRSLLLVAAVPVYQLIMAACFFYVCRDRDEMGFFPGAVLLFFSWTVNAMVLHAVENLLAVRRLQNEIQTLYELRQENRDIHRLGVQYEQERRRIWRGCVSRLDKAYEMLGGKGDFGTVRNTLEDAFRQIRTCERAVYCENPIVNSVLVLKKRLAEEKNIPMHIITCVDKETGVDPLDLCSLFCNLIDNAIKFSREDSVIYIQTSVRYEKVFVSVKDTGVGIPKNNIKKIWERFYKSDVSRGKDKKGTGLGLAIVKEIIQAHGENIDVVSTEGVGTEFIFSLPKATTL